MIDQILSDGVIQPSILTDGGYLNALSADPDTALADSLDPSWRLWWGGANPPKASDIAEHGAAVSANADYPWWSGSRPPTAADIANHEASTNGNNTAVPVSTAMGVPPMFPFLSTPSFTTIRSQNASGIADAQPVQPAGGGSVNWVALAIGAGLLWYVFN